MLMSIVKDSTRIVRQIGTYQNVKYVSMDWKPRDGHIWWSTIIWDKEDMHFVWFSMWDGFVSPQVYECHSNLWDSSGIWRRVVRNPSRMENHTKCIFSHTSNFNTVEGALIKAEDHENHARWIYLTTVLSMGVGKLEACENTPCFCANDPPPPPTNILTLTLWTYLQRINSKVPISRHNYIRMKTKNSWELLNYVSQQIRVNWGIIYHAWKHAHGIWLFGRNQVAIEFYNFLFSIFKYGKAKYEVSAKVKYKVPVTV